MHSNWPYLQKYAASDKGIFHRMLNNVVLLKYFLGWNDGLFWGVGGLYHIVKICFDVPEDCTVTFFYFCWPCISVYFSVINQLDARHFCFTISFVHASTCFEHMCLKHVEAWNKLIVKQKFCASSCLITETNVLWHVRMKCYYMMWKP